MGSITCHCHSQKKEVLEKDFEIVIDRKRPLHNIDLPYRHYINKSYYIASALPHNVNEFNHKKVIKISKNIQQSSIMMRRFLEQNPSSTRISYGSN